MVTTYNKLNAIVHIIDGSLTYIFRVIDAFLSINFTLKKVHKDGWKEYGRPSSFSYKRNEAYPSKKRTISLRNDERISQ